MNTVQQPMYEWKDINWQQCEREVYKLQKRIYRATQRGEAKTTHRLQRLLMSSRSAKLLATRRVTQDNQGKKTAGVDGRKSLNPRERLALAKHLHLSGKAKPTRRVWIAKPNSAEKRPLGIPTISDRAEQALAKLALEPEWEAQFEPNSYGFRPGRSCHDAIEAIFLAIKTSAKYVLDADIAKCFDRINHAALLQKLHTYPAMRRAIKAWLKAGVMDGGKLYPTEEGTPQGGVLSPLLANIALHGLETAVTTAFPRVRSKGQDIRQPNIVRYADDFLCLYPDLAVIEQVKQFVTEWLKGMGLELKPSKTRITHTLHQHNGNVGFDFLGYQIRQYPVGKTHSGKHAGRSGQLLGFKTLTKPSKEAIRTHWRTIKRVVKAHKPATQEALINHLNPIIRGWANYYSTGTSSQTFSKLRGRLFSTLLSWANRRHPNKSKHWIASKYWHPERGKWQFATTSGVKLYEHTQTHIRRHVKVKGERSPYDGDWLYWATRMGTHPEVPTRVAVLLRRQQGRCTHCNLYFRDGDVMEVDHIIPRSQGGKDEYNNFQLLHRHCHDQKTAGDNNLVGSIRDKNQTIEEPDERKRSRPVLQPSGVGDCPA